jgi:outer membrane protein TolC
MATARAIGVYPGWDVLTEAELLNEERDEIGRKLDISTAIGEALASNLDLAARARFVASGKYAVREAGSVLLPQIDLSATGAIIDQDRAQASFGQAAERSVVGSVTATQILYSEPAWANYSIQENLQEVRGQDLRQLRFDIIQAAAAAYFNVLKAETFEKMQKQNLKRTRSNLELAQVRDAVGMAGPAEVYRWESEIATNRRTVIDAAAVRTLATMELNRLLHRSTEELIVTTEVNLEDFAPLSGQQELVEFLRDPRAFSILRSFMVEESYRNSPELAALDAAIAAQSRALSSATHSFWAPTLELQGRLGHTFLREGAGTESSSGSSLPVDLPPYNDTYWTVGLNLWFPLFQGGGKFARRSGASEELEQLRLERRALVERIEQRVRSSLHTVAASYAGINQARLAAEAAAKSLEVVENAYSRGAISILDLLDAQNVALVAELDAANAVYDFLIDHVAFQRAAGRFELLVTDEEQEAFFDRAREYFEKRGVSLEIR